MQTLGLIVDSTLAPDVAGEQDESALHFELFGPSHPWPTGYIREAAFAPGAVHDDPPVVRLPTLYACA